MLLNIVNNALSLSSCNANGIGCLLLDLTAYTYTLANGSIGLLLDIVSHIFSLSSCIANGIGCLLLDLTAYTYTLTNSSIGLLLDVISHIFSLSSCIDNDIIRLRLDSIGNICSLIKNISSILSSFTDCIVYILASFIDCIIDGLPYTIKRLPAAKLQTIENFLFISE